MKKAWRLIVAVASVLYIILLIKKGWYTKVYLPGFSQAIEAVYTKAEIQKCIIHQIRNSTKYVSYKDIKELMKDLKAVYKASTEELALTNLGIFEEKWDKKYPMCVSSWKITGQNYPHISNIQKG